jgi:hypothetical protein
MGHETPHTYRPDDIWFSNFCPITVDYSDRSTAKCRLNPEEMQAESNSWLADGRTRILFASDPTAKKSVDKIWSRACYLCHFPSCEICADLAVRFISCEEAKSGAERILSPQKDGAGPHDPLLILETILAGIIAIQSRRSRSSKAMTEGITNKCQGYFSRL